MTRKKVTTDQILKRKGGKPITLLSAYDYPVARAADQAKIDIVLVSDALAMVGLGQPDTLSITVDAMIHHTRAVKAGSGSCLVVATLPFLSYSCPQDAVRNAGRLIKEGGADAVELEGGAAVSACAKALFDNGIAIFGHIGLTKQFAARTGSHRTQGKTVASALSVFDDARALEAAGAFATLIECVPAELALIITKSVSIPTIGIGAGAYCDGQGLVSQDMLGLYDKFCPKFVRQYAQLSSEMTRSFNAFASDVEASTFPAAEHQVPMEEAVLHELRVRLADRETVTPRPMANALPSAIPASKTITTKKPGK